MDVQPEVSFPESRSELTMLFTDLEGSTRLVQHLDAAYQELLTQHFDVLRTAVAEHRGREVSAHSDAFFAVFDSPADALGAAVAIQRRMAETVWPGSEAVRVRVGLHTGTPKQVTDRNIGYIGIDVHRGARIADAANGGQILLSAATYSRLADRSEPVGAAIRYAGMHRLKDLHYPENIYELVVWPDKAYPPIRSLTAHGTNLPDISSAFVGREQELKQLRELLCAGDARIVTLTGPGGSGKTRLSIEAAKPLTRDFPGGVFQVPLSGISEPSFVAAAIAQTLGVPEFPGVSIVDGLKHAIASKRVLLVIDNFEQVTEAAPVLSELVATCKSLKVLVTSREPLHISGEVEFRLAPLCLPPSHYKGAVEDLLEHDSIRLFADRAKQANPQFAMTEDNVATAAEICRRLDGLPLAIELAASRLRFLTMRGLLERMSSGLDALGRSPRDADRRHSTLRDTIAWSYGLLSKPEQQVFAALSVFVEGFDSAAAEEVLGRSDILDEVISLCDKSLLSAESAEGEARFRMLATIREFASECLAATGLAEEMERRHATYFLGLAEQLAPSLVSADQRRAVSRLHVDAENIRAVLSWALNERQADVLGRMLKALLWYWIPQSRFAEGNTWIEHALPTARALGSKADLAKILDVGGWLRMISGDYAGALPLFEEASALYADNGSEDDQTRTLMCLGITTAVAKGDMQGVEMIREALTQYQKAGNLHGAGLALIALGEVARAGGETETAAECYGEALQAMRSSSDTYWTAALLLNMAQLRLQDGDWQTAQGLLGEALALGQEYNYPMVTTLYIAAMGKLALGQGRPAEAAKLFGATDALLATLGVSFEPADMAMLAEAASEAKATLGEERYGWAYALGSGWTQEQAIAATLELRD